VIGLSKIEAGRMDRVVAPIDPGRFIEDSVETCPSAHRRQPQPAVVERDRGLGTVASDVTKLCKVVRNLMSNAAKVTEGGVITLGNRTPA
jgi:signal transduction histidine kinase